MRMQWPTLDVSTGGWADPPSWRQSPLWRQNPPQPLEADAPPRGQTLPFLAVGNERNWTANAKRFALPKKNSWRYSGCLVFWKLSVCVREGTCGTMISIVT